jgi:hypothetical protein
MSDHHSRLPEPLAHCPFCATSYAEEAVRAISKQRDVHMSHATCRQCGRAMMFAVDRRGGQIACVGVITDCSADEAIQFENAQKISLDEVLRAHVQLRN